MWVFVSSNPCSENWLCISIILLKILFKIVVVTIFSLIKHLFFPSVFITLFTKISSSYSISNSLRVSFTFVKFVISINAETLIGLPLFGLKLDFALSPVIKLRESRIIDFPAPVSPVRTHKPCSNERST